MNCKNCNTENPEGARFCRVCGSELKANFLDVHPLYVPSSLYNWRNPFKYVEFGFKLMFLLGLFFALYIPVYELIDVLFYGNEIFVYEFILAFVVGGLLLFVSIPGMRFSRKKQLRDEKRLSAIADYVKRYSYFTSKYTFYVKDGKMGLLDVRKFKIHFPAEYDAMEWKQKNKLLAVTKNDRQYIIDIFGNELK